MDNVFSVLWPEEPGLSHVIVLSTATAGVLWFALVCLRLAQIRGATWLTREEFCEPSGFIYYRFGISVDMAVERAMECVECILGLRTFASDGWNVACSQDTVRARSESNFGESWACQGTFTLVLEQCSNCSVT